MDHFAIQWLQHAQTNCLSRELSGASDDSTFCVISCLICDNQSQKKRCECCHVRSPHDWLFSVSLSTRTHLYQVDD